MNNQSEDRLDVVVVGNIGIDTNVYLYGADIDWTVEGNFTENIDYIGQAGGYTSRGYAQLGRPTAFIGHVGRDASGRLIRETLTQDGVDQSALFVDPAGTARSINIMYRDGRRKNFYDGKGHMTLEPPMDACKILFAQAKLAHFHIPNWARHLLPMAEAAGVVIACDIQDVVDLEDPYRQDFIDAADIIFFSAANHADPTPLMELLLAGRPTRIVVSGMGAKGCALGTAAGIQFFPPVDLPEPVIDTNGAGDGLAVGFLTSYVLEGLDLETSILRGQLNARHTCTQRASTDALMTAERLDALTQQFKTA